MSALHPVMHAALAAVMPAARPHKQQPMIPADAELHLAGYEHDGLFLDLYGFRDAGKPYVWHVALMGDRRDLSPLFQAGYEHFDQILDAAGVA